MNRRIIKRVLFWAVGFPLVLIVILVGLLFVGDQLAPDTTEKAVVKVVSLFTPFGTYIDNVRAVEPAYQALEKGDYDRVMALCDSLQEQSSGSAVELNLLRATACLKNNRHRSGEVYLKKAVASFSGQDIELGVYASASYKLGQLLNDKGDYKDAVETVTSAIDLLEEHKGNIYTYASNLPNLYTTLGTSLARLGNVDEADARYSQAFEAYNNTDALYDINTSKEKKAYYSNEKQTTLSEIAIFAFMRAGRYDMAKRWFEKEDSVYAYIVRNDSLSTDSIGLHHYKYHLMKAQMLEHEGDRAGADKEYKLCQDFPVSQYSSSIMSQYEYLTTTERWPEVLQLYEKIDTAAIGDLYSLDNINKILMPRYRALRGTGQTPKALQLADSLSRKMKNAIQTAKNDDAAELATIYETQQKEAKIAEREATINHQRIIGLLVALVLITIAFTVYILIRRRVMRMKAQHEQLENELRIARDIQMSMVPSTFPDFEGLDMYAQMTPAKEVGGDLYGYVVKDSRLYFAVGDVSGKGVPASLFMAQATRLFRTLATQGMMPAEICTRMNEALSGDDNVKGMFVTMFIGLLDLETGHLDFCNAGHNPPVIGMDHCQLSIVNYQFLTVNSNAPIGLWPELVYEGEEIESIKGCPLFIYTDGLNEAEDESQKQFGDDRILDIMRHTTSENARRMIETLAAEVEKHRNGAEPNDDLTMMCIIKK